MLSLTRYSQTFQPTTSKIAMQTDQKLHSYKNKYCYSNIQSLQKNMGKNP